MASLISKAVSGQSSPGEGYGSPLGVLGNRHADSRGKLQDAKASPKVRLGSKDHPARSGASGGAQRVAKNNSPGTIAASTAGFWT